MRRLDFYIFMLLRQLLVVLQKWLFLDKLLVVNCLCSIVFIVALIQIALQLLIMSNALNLDPTADADEEEIDNALTIQTQSSLFVSQL